MYQIIRGDCLTVLPTLDAQSVDLVFGSPPYELARLYLENGEDMGIARGTEDWVAWMIQVYRASLRVCRGLVAFVVEGQTRDFRYSAGPALLMADLHRAGIHLRKPPAFHRVGIPGSGGPDWLRNDTECIICATNGGRLPWSDNTALGKPCRYAPGGAMSHRMKNGERVGDKVVYQVTCTDGYKDGQLLTKKGSYAPPEKANPGNVIQCTQSEYEVISFLTRFCDATNSSSREVVRMVQIAIREKTLPFWLLGAAETIRGKEILLAAMHGGIVGEAPRGRESESERQIRSSKDSESDGVHEMRSDRRPSASSQRRRPNKQPKGQCRGSLPEMSSNSAQANEASEAVSSLREETSFIGLVRGSLSSFQDAWRSSEEMLEQSLWSRCLGSDLIHCVVGGGRMGGDVFASQSEAPFPEALAEFFIRSFCPEGGTVLDTFAGSGTTCAVAVRCNRKAIGIDIRQSQIDIAERRIRGETPEGLFA